MNTQHLPYASTESLKFLLGVGGIAFLSLVQYKFSCESRVPHGSHMKICGLPERKAL